MLPKIKPLSAFSTIASLKLETIAASSAIDSRTAGPGVSVQNTPEPWRSEDYELDLYFTTIRSM
jgi:hypothetical protein